MNARKSLIALCLAVGTLSAGVTTPVSADVYVRIAPPAPRYEAVPVARSGWEWAPGYWDWNGRSYMWVKGHRVRAQRGAHWVPHRWREESGRWRMERGHWDRRDRDHGRHH